MLLNRGDSYYVREVIRGKFPFNKLIDKIIEVKERYGKAASLVIEEGAISYGLIQSLGEKHINVAPYNPKGDKAERLISQKDLFEGGSVLLPKDAHSLGTARHGSRRWLSEGHSDLEVKSPPGETTRGRFCKQLI